MSQFNLDTSPYFDDFDADKDYYKVLFKPGFPVQARELNVLQSILQNQISNFGEHFFKEGSLVIPGNLTYNAKYDSVVLNPQQGGIDISLYLDQLVGVTIRGEISGVKAKVVNYVLPPNEGVSNPTIFVSYTDSGDNSETAKFIDNEALINEAPVVYGNTTITAGSIFATTVSIDATFVGSAANLAEGIYFIRGTFVQVKDSTVVLDPYSNTPSFRVGLQINETVVTAGQDDSLYDNAKGFNNFSAPGADRLKITAVLAKKPSNDFNDTNFVELLKVEAGEIKKLTEDSDFNIIKDYLAKRTYDESGDYVVEGLGVTIDESLNNGLGNGGIYQPDQKTEQGGTPSDDLAVLKVSRGKAYVRGYDIPVAGTVNIDAPKPRTTETVARTSVPFEMGSQYVVDNVIGTPVVGLDLNDNIVELYNRRVDAGGAVPGAAIQIGEARPYNFSLVDAPQTGPETPWNLYLFDVQLFTELTLNVAAPNIEESFRIRGLSSGSSGFVKNISGNLLVLTEVDGEFARGESISVNGQTVDSYTITAVTAYKPSDVKSIFQNSPALDPNLQVPFSCDSVLFTRIPETFVPSDLFTITAGGVVTCPGKNFGRFFTDQVIAYQKPGDTLLTYNRVASVDATETSMVVVAESTVPGVAVGSLPAGDIQTGLRIADSRIENQENSFLYVVMEETNLSKVNLAESDVLFSSQVTNQSTDAAGTLVVNTSALNVDDSLFVAFDQERYSVHYSDGVVAQIRSDQFALINGGLEFRISDLRPSQVTNITVNVTAIKSGIKSKTKILLKSQELLIDKASSGIATITYGLRENNYYGLRVDDEEISLNFPDVENVVAIYESLDATDPQLDILNFVGGLQLDTTTVQGELLVGQTTNAIARLVSTPTPSSTRIVYLSQARFSAGEIVKFSESDIETPLQSILPGNYADLTSQFTLDKGQREQFYDYSRLVRKRNVAAPNKRLLVIFDRFGVPAGDKGDFYTVNSYQPEVFDTGIPLLANGTIRASDTLDFRPRVSQFQVTDASPFNYTSRDFGNVGSTIPLVPAPNESTVLGYDFYVGRKDRLTLDSIGEFKLVQGIPAKQPQLPAEAEAAMEIAQITYPPYLYNVDDAQIAIVDNRRYTMRDIGGLEDRIENLEEVTSLSLLERATDSLQVLDADGNSRFKSGFFADDFKNAEFVNFDNPETKCDIAPNPGSLIPLTEFATIPLRPELQNGINPNDVGLGTDLPLIDPNTRKTGDLVTLDFQDSEWIKQPLASRVENVNPFNVVLYNGGIVLNPASDDFIVTRDIDGRRINTFGEPVAEFNRTFVEGIEVAQFMRERNVAFSASALRPNTRFYPFFEGASGIDIIPKLVEITMRTGTFQAGETVRGFNGTTEIFSCRAAVTNQKEGPFNNPTRTYTTNPYNRDELVPASYSASSTLLNVDLDSLADITDDRFGGLIAQGTRLVGESSGAVADVSQIRLVTDGFGELAASFFFRNPFADPAPAFRLRTGARTFRLTSSPTNETPVLGDTIISFADVTFTSGGTVQNRIVDRVVIRELPAPPPPIVIDNTVTLERTIVIDRTVTVRTPPVFVPRPVPRPVPIFIRVDPLAQTFRADGTGAFLTGVDLFFASKSQTDTLTVQVRPTELATPTEQLVQDFAQVVLSPDQVEISDDASVPTRVLFPSPLYLEPDITYAIVLLAPTTNDYTAWIARMGEENITEDPEGAAIIGQQYLNGSLFKSQNGSVWTASQFEDLKFTLYKALFTEEPGTLYLSNPPLGNNTQLTNNPIQTLPRRIRVPLNNTNYAFNIGDKIVSTGSGAPNVIEVIGDLDAIGGSITTTTITDPGLGFIDGNYSDVGLYAINSSGIGARADINILNNEITGVTIFQSGGGYKIGDTVGIVTADVDGSGGDALITITGISSADTLFLTNVTGEKMSETDQIQILDQATGLPTPTGVSIAVPGSVVDGPMNEGNIFIVDFPSHGMQADTNFCEIQGVLPDTPGTQLTLPIDTSTNIISVVDPTSFGTFEGITTTTGYAYVGGEIIEYTDNGDGTLGITSRGVDNTLINIHDQGDLIYKYEMSGVSLRRINTIHPLPTDSILGDTRGINELPLAFDRTTRPGGINQINFNQDQQAGGNSARASQNFQYVSTFPSIGLLTPGSTTEIESNIRTVTGTSSGGNEQSFVDEGYVPVTLNGVTAFDSPRLVASRVNEIEYLQDIPNNRSYTLALTFKTTDTSLSPVIDLSQANAILARAMINNPVKNYADDPAVKQLIGDPHSSIYISERVDLANPATSLKVLLSAYRDATADFRVLYRLFGADSQGSTEPTWELFPGYNNLIDVNGDGFGQVVIDPSKNDGLPNKRVRSSALLEVLEYNYEVNDLPEFQAFELKIVFSGTNEARNPFIQDLRAIALA